MTEAAFIYIMYRNSLNEATKNCYRKQERMRRPAGKSQSSLFKFIFTGILHARVGGTRFSTLGKRENTTRVSYASIIRVADFEIIISTTGARIAGFEKEQFSG